MSSVNKLLETLNHRLHSLTAAMPADDDRYYVLYHKSMWRFAETLKKHPNKFEVPEKPIQWGLFADGTDKIDIPNSREIAGKKVLFLANIESNSYFMAQLHVLNYLGLLRPGSLSIVLPFLTTGTMERIASGEEDRVPTAFTAISLFNSLPQIGPPTLIVTYDIHALQEQFYFKHPAVAGLRSAIPLLLRKINSYKINCIAFPDDGAKKRFANYFRGWELVVCEKTRPPGGGPPVVKMTAGNPAEKHVLIVDDQTKSGGTFFSCIEALMDKNNGKASRVSAFVTHPVFNDPLNPNHNPAMSDKEAFWPQITECLHTWGTRFGNFYVTNSIPSIHERVERFEQENPGHSEKFVILDLAEQLALDLQQHCI